MTAEIAILNKSAVVLASDSAVTISAGSNQQKIYDSADKLFELSASDPIAVMVNGGMNFAQIPLDVLIKMYREECKIFDHVPEAASDFLEYLFKYGISSPARIKDEYLQRAITPYLEKIKERSDETFFSAISNYDVKNGVDIKDFMNDSKISALTEQTNVMIHALNKLSDASFIGKKKSKISKNDDTIIKSIIKRLFPDAQNHQIIDLINVCRIALLKSGPGISNTGIIVAGFGKKDLFPTLVHYSIYGIIGNQLKYTKNETVDIDRDGARAKVIPFAQKEMVERFLYGLDEGNRRNIMTFCRRSVPEIRKKLLEILDINEADKIDITKAAEEAERVFLDGLAENSFNDIRAKSQSEIEDMVEFMPKPEMARMAEALVNLTSIKRRVSRGMETVGGPIDVAVISRSEGLVWVQRKHYFPPELNARFFDRKRLATKSPNGQYDSDGDAK